MIKIAKQTTGPLAGFPLLEIDWPRFIEYKSAVYAKNVQYGFGAKDPHVGTFPPTYSKIDCSGFVETLLDYATHGVTVADGMPDGSYLEADWFKAEGFKRVSDYSDVPNWASYLLVGIHRPNGRGGDAVGHIWLLIHGHTVESYGGHGPGERPWNHQWFIDHVDELYVLAHGPA